MKQALSWALLGFILLTQYINCSTYSDNSLFDSSAINLTAGGDVPVAGLYFTNDLPYINCNEDHIQLGGVCNTGDGFENFIAYRISRNKQEVVWSRNGATVNQLTDAKCENGRFVAVLPRPYDPGALAGTATAFVEYQVVAQIYTRSKDQTTWTEGPKSPSFRVMFQPSGASCVQ